MSVQLSTGAVEDLAQGVKYKNGEVPVVLQLLNFKKVGGGNTERLRVLVSDGVHTLNSATFAPSLNSMSELQQQNCVFRCSKYTINSIAAGSKKVVVFMNAEIVKEGFDCERIGKPTPWVDAPEDKTARVNNTPHSDISSTVSSASSLTPASPHPQAGGGRVFSANPTTPLANKTSSLQLNSPASSRTSGGGGSTHPIVGLNPYQTKWVIKGRCMGKSALRNYNNAKGPGKLFNFEVADSSGEIRITGFNDQVDKFFDLIEPERVYLITGCSVKAANKQFNKTGHDYELTLNSNSLIEAITDDGEAPKLCYNFVSIDKLVDCAPNSNVDVIGVVQAADECQEVTSRATQKSFMKREINVVDKSLKTVIITLWGQDAENFNMGDTNPVISIKGAVVKEFGGRTLSMGGSSSFLLNPDIPEAHALSGWYSETGGNLVTESVSSMGAGGLISANTQLMSIEDAREAKLGMNGDKADFYTTKATFVFFKKDGNNVLYPGCKKCKKKLIDEGNGFYRCEKCVESSQEFNWFSVIQANVADHSDNLWLTLFNESVEVVLGHDVNELGRLKQMESDGGSLGDSSGGGGSEFNKVFAQANFKSYLFKIRVKLESYNDETRLKSSVVSVSKVNPVDHGLKLLQEIDKLSQLK